VSAVRDSALPRDHDVTIYDEDSHLVDELTEFVTDGLALGEAVVLVATPAHRAALAGSLESAGCSLHDAVAGGQLHLTDAAETLASFLRDGRPDPDLFFETVGGLLEHVARTGRPVRVFGEMVALLWDAGNVLAAIELEGLWNDLGRELPFSLFCAYPTQSVSGSEHSDALREVCQLHSAVIHPHHEHSRQFPADIAAPAAARRFVVETLQRQGYDPDVIDDAALVVTELATNAVMHAQAPFTVAVSAEHGRPVRISVTDASATMPVQRHDGPMAQSGRGVFMVATVSNCWGTELTDDGKVVWAELHR
jgi:anti-sigma regulatory factor (Ser/Thr protein kinase)